MIIIFLYLILKKGLYEDNQIMWANIFSCVTYFGFWQGLLLNGPLHWQLVSSSNEEQLNSIVFSFITISLGTVSGAPSGYLLSIWKLDLPPRNKIFLNLITKRKKIKANHLTFKSTHVCLTSCDHTTFTGHNPSFILRNGCWLDKLINKWCGKNINLDQIMHPEK